MLQIQRPSSGNDLAILFIPPLLKARLGSLFISISPAPVLFIPALRYKTLFLNGDFVANLARYLYSRLNSVGATMNPALTLSEIEFQPHTVPFHYGLDYFTVIDFMQSSVFQMVNSTVVLKGRL